MDTIETVALALKPLDILLFRDGRPLEGGIHVHSSLPPPQTIAGALRTFMLERRGCDFDRLMRAVGSGATFEEALAVQGEQVRQVAGTRFRGPWPARGGVPLLPAPASVHVLQDEPGRLVRLDPLAEPFPGWRPRDGEQRPLWWRGRERTGPLGGYVTLSGIAAFLAGGMPAPDQCVAAEDLFLHDARTGIAIAQGRSTVDESLIYSVDYLSVREDVTFLVEVEGPRSLLAETFARPSPMSLGGQGRYVVVQRCDRPAWPSAPAGGKHGDGRLVLLTSPAPFADGWRPAALRPVAAAVPGHVAVSGWDLARRGPKVTRFAVPAGAVFFCGSDAVLPAGQLLDGEDAAVGWGTYLEGVWRHA